MTSASGVLRKYWYQSKTGVISPFMKSALPSLLPNFLPDESRRSGNVSPKADFPRILRTRSVPAVMLPHWSAPPTSIWQP